MNAINPFKKPSKNNDMLTISPPSSPSSSKIELMRKNSFSPRFIYESVPLSYQNESFDEDEDFQAPPISATLTNKLADRMKTNIYMLEISQRGDKEHKYLTLRDLLIYINKIANKYNMKSTSNARLSPLVEDDKSVNSNSVPSEGARLQLIQHRDLRRLEYQFNPLGEPIVLVRRHAVIVSLDPLRAVIMADRMMLIIPSEGFEHVLDLLYKIMEGLQADPIPFEAMAYEAILEAVIAIQVHPFHPFLVNIIEPCD